MSILVNFDGKIVIEPGAHSRITAGFIPPAPTTTFGDVVLIDTGSGAGYGFGGGINGELSNGDQAIYEFANPLSAKKAIRGGRLYDVQDYLWAPRKGAGGPRRVFLVKAATTVAPKLALVLGTSPNQVTLNIAAKTEGVAGNGVVTSTILHTGYGMKLRAGVVNTAKFYLEFYEGQYRGKDANNIEYEFSVDKATNYVCLRSPEVATSGELVTWMQNNADFKALFQLVGTIPATSQAITSANITTFGTAIAPFTGGTTVYNPADVDTALAACEDLENALFLADDFGIVGSPTSQQIQDGCNKGAQSSANVKILSHMLNNATYTDKTLFIGGGKDKGEFALSVTGGTLHTTNFYNDEGVVVVHSNILVPNNFGGGNKEIDAFYHAAMACGLTAGLQPQQSATAKAVRVTGVKHVMSKAEREQALQGGVWHLRKVAGQWVVNQSVNSLQRNTTLFNADGTSFEVSIKRCKHQLNKELKMAASVVFPGANYNTLDREDVKLFTERFLTERCATDQQDNILISFRNVNPVFSNDSWFTDYCFVVNGPINKGFFTGYLLDPNVELNNN